jgi:hypothetical protein
MRIEFVSEPDRMEEPDLVMEQPELPVHNYQREMNTIRELLTQTENDIVQGEREVRELSSQIANLPTMRA